MYTLRVGAGGSGAMDFALAALARELRPGWRVEVDQTGTASSESRLIPIEIPELDRWAAVLIDEADFEAAARALADGARSVIPLSAHVEEFEATLETLVAEAGLFVAPTVARGIARGLLDQRGRSGASQDALPRLTRRESEVLALVAAGLTNREIAERLSLSVNTVRTHLQTLANKLRATTRAKLVASAWGAGLHTSKRSESTSIAS